ncbi:MAG: hypothetical protein HQ461_15900 [Deltaproteobacteria bacterium]|nr:hypothetical protein [Deltaproteobacteria bacterium]
MSKPLGPSRPSTPNLPGKSGGGRTVIPTGAKPVSGKPAASKSSGGKKG